MTEQNVPKILDELHKDAKEPPAFEAMFRSLKKSLIERALGAELSSHLGYARGISTGISHVHSRRGSNDESRLKRSTSWAANSCDCVIV